MAALAVTAAAAGCAPASPLAGTDPLELSVKPALNAQLDRAGPLSESVDVRCVRLGRAFECDADVVVDASFMGVRFLSTSARDVIGGYLGGLSEPLSLPVYFGALGALPILAGVAMVLASRHVVR